MDWRRVRQVRRVYWGVHAPPVSPILFCNIESALRVHFEAIPYSARSGRMAVERLAELPVYAIASVIFMLVTQQAESARMPSATLITGW